MVCRVIRKADSRKCERSKARPAQKKAEEFVAAAKSDLEQSRWNAAGLTAIHAGICAADAGLIASAALRSASQDHGAVIQLLDDQVPEFSPAQKRHLTGLLSMKNRVAYEQRLLTVTEARQLVDHADRLTRWSGGVVGRHLDD